MSTNRVCVGSTGRRRLPREIGRERIVAAAAAMLVDKPLSEASISDLAITLSMTTANIYKHFSSKRVLADAVCARHAATAIERLRRLLGQDLAADRLVEALVVENVRYARENFHDQPNMAALLRLAAIERWPGYAEMAAGLHDILAELIASGVRQGVFRADLPPDTAHTVLMALKSVMHPILLDELPAAEIDDHARRMTGFVLQALRKPDRHARDALG